MDSPLNFLFQDMMESVLATGLFPIFLVVPGYSVAYVLDLWKFRHRGLPTRLALSVVLSIAIIPSSTYLLSRMGSFQLTCTLLVMAALLFLGFVARTLSLAAIRSHITDLRAGRFVRWLALIIIGWMTVTIFLLSDFQIADRLYPNVGVYDYALRIAVTDSITRTAIPPANPSFYPGHPVPLYYYYFWFMTCSLVDLLGGPWIEPRAAVIAGTAWIGVGLIAIVALYIRLLAKPPNQPRERLVLLAIALLLVTGFYIVPLLGKYVYHLFDGRLVAYPTVEWWNDQITAWPTAVLWVPHHVAALVATLTAFLVYSSLPHVDGFGRRVATVIVSALALCSAVGLSIWVAFSFAVFWGVWAVVSFLKGWHGEARGAVVVGILAAILSIPYVMELHRANLDHSVTPIIVSIRQFVPIHAWLENHQASSVMIAAADLIALPLNYFMELGFFAVAGIMYWSWRVRRPEALRRQELALLTLTLTAAVIATFLRSNIANNDLGWRSAMFVQLALLIWAVDVVDRLFGRRMASEQRGDMPFKTRRTILLISAVIGILPVWYDMMMMKLYPMLGDLHVPVVRAHGFLDEQNLGRRYYDVREAYEWMNRQLPASAVLQHNPDVFMDLPSGLYGNRQVAAAGHYYGPIFGISESVYRPVSQAISAVFTSDTAERRSVSEVCRRFGIAAFIVKDTDPIWSMRDSWVFRELPVFANDSSRVFSCERLVASRAATDTRDRENIPP
jgi:hypothetical protein